MELRTSFYEQLLQLPLFQGTNRSDFMEIVEKVKFSFFKARETQLVARQDTLSNRLVFILRGSVRTEHTSDDHSYSFSERLIHQTVIQPESLFGLSNHYSRNYWAEAETKYLSINKDAVRDFLFLYPTFRINFLNLLSTQVQQKTRLLWRQTPETPHKRFALFVLKHCSHPAGEKTLKIKMEQLAKELLETRLNVSKMLHELSDKELVSISRGKIVIPKAENLFGQLQ